MRVLYTSLALFVVLALTSCGERTGWTQAEVDNFDHFLAAQSADHRAMDVPLAGPGSTARPEDIEQIVLHTENALKEAQRVEDGVLEKARGGMSRLYREQYEQALRLRIQGVRAGDAEVHARSVALHNRWVDWYNASRREIRVPKAGDDTEEGLGRSALALAYWAGMFGVIMGLSKVFGDSEGANAQLSCLLVLELPVGAWGAWLVYEALGWWWLWKGLFAVCVAFPLATALMYLGSAVGFIATMLALWPITWLRERWGSPPPEVGDPS